MNETTRSGPAEAPKRSAASTRTTGETGAPTAPFRRVLGFARPYAGIIAAVALCTLLFSAGRYGRAYLMKPLLDDVLVPAVAPVAHDPAPDPLDDTGDDDGWLVEALARVVADAGAESARREPTAPGAARGGATAIPEALARILVAAALIVVVTPLALFGRVYLGSYALGRIHVDVQRRLADRLLAMPLARYAGRRTGDLLTRLQVDVVAVREALRLVFEEFLVAFCMLAVGVATLLYISVPLTAASLLAAPVIAAVLIGFGRTIRRRARKRQVRLGELTERLVAMLSGLKMIRAFGREDTEAQAFGREAERVFRADLRVVQSGVLARASVEALNSAAGFAMLLVGSILVLQGRFGLTTGDVAAFATVLATTYKPIKNVAKGFGKLMEQLASGERLFAVLDAPTEPAPSPGASPIERIEKGIAFEGVGLVHHDETGREKAVLRDVDLSLERGEVVAIVGRSGAGKTSLVDLMLGLYRPTTGRITVDGTPLADVDPASLRSRMAVVDQEAFLFDTTIGENIRFGRPGATDAQVEAAARAAHVDEFVGALPAGLDARVGAFGLKLSGGQRQRIAIARALLREPDVLVFDEATSALDPKTERIVREAIGSLRGDRLIVIVSHRLASVRDADRIVVVEAGRIVESGRHEALMALRGAYRELAES